jgi:hypothetical protein
VVTVKNGWRLVVPLPDNPLAPWPPRQLREPYAAFRTWGAWYSGDPEQLADAYGHALGYGEVTAPAGDDGSILPLARQRWFWGKRLGGRGDLADSRLHIPLASDIAATSADLLFAESPSFSVEEEDGGPGGAGPKPTTARLDMLMNEGGWLPVLIESAEIAASASGVFLRAGWNDDVADHVIIDAISPDCAVPEWIAGRLSAVTFWRTLYIDPDADAQQPGGGGRVWRHLERHETRDGTGRVVHGLYVGDGGVLGELVDLAAHPDTSRLAQTAEPAPENRLLRQVITGAQRIAVEWWPNMRPARKLAGTAYGRSDYDGIEPALDALDECWSSWLRDLRIGKGRIFIPREYMQDQGRGRGALFDADQSVYQLIDSLPSAEGLAMQAVQFQIRVEQHQQTATSLTAQALRGAGYSTQTFGEAGEVAVTATEVVARERRSYTTRARKILYGRPMLARLAQTALQIDLTHFGPDRVQAVRPQIEWPDGVAQDPGTLAQTVNLLHGAEAASLYVRVGLFHPDWNDAQIREEIDRIRGDQRAAVAVGMPVAEPGAAVAEIAAETAAEEPGEGGVQASGGEVAGLQAGPGPEPGPEPGRVPGRRQLTRRRIGPPPAHR